MKSKSEIECNITDASERCGNESGRATPADSVQAEANDSTERNIRSRRAPNRIPAVWLALFVGATLASAAVAQSTNDAPSRPRYLPEYTTSGDLILPKNFHEWVYVGSPLTPNALNGGKAGFPEFHNVYIEPGSYEIYKRTNVFPEGTILFKELQLTLPPAENADGSRTEPSGRGYFPGPFNGADVTVKDTKRYADTDGWGYYNFNHHEPKAPTAKLRPKEECGYCHIASAKKDDVWTQFYPLLDVPGMPDIK
jgi:hypothetical protein